jgi:DNA-directed RNA polymerase specialized sigma24 family protein
LIKRLGEEKKIVQKIVHKGEQLTKFFSAQVPVERILEELEDKKYSDVRNLLTQGLKPDRIAKELSVPEAEVRMIAQLGASRS